MSQSRESSSDSSSGLHSPDLPPATNQEGIYDSEDEFHSAEPARRASSASSGPEDSTPGKVSSTENHGDCPWHADSEDSFDGHPRRVSTEGPVRNQKHEEPFRRARSVSSGHSRRSSASRRPSSFLLAEAAYRSLGRLLPRRIPDETSETAAQVISKSSIPATVISMSVSTAQREDPAYYIVQAGTTKSACYLFHHQAEDSDDSYQTESVPVEVSNMRSGRPAYIVGISDQQQRSDHDAFPTSMNVSIGKAEGDAPDVSRKPSNGVIYPIHQHRESIVTRSLIQQLVDKAQQRIKSRLISNMGVHVVQQDGKHLRDFNKMYLLRSEDVEDMVEAVAEEIRRRRNCFSAMRSISVPDIDKPALPRLSESNHGILPSLGAVADPATTFFQPRTSLATKSPFDSQIRTTFRDQDDYSTATIVSRKSVAEIVWDRDDHPTNAHAEQQLDLEAKRSLKRIESMGDESRSTSKCKPQVTFAGFSMNQHASEDDPENLVVNVGWTSAETHSRPDENVWRLTSFPQFDSRYNTDEWPVPPANLDAESSLPTSQFYLQGIDAHSGTEPVSWAAALEEKPTGSQPYDYGLIENNVFADAWDSKSFTTETARRASSFSMFRDKQPGSSVGASSHRRKSSHIPTRKDSSNGREDGLIPSLVDMILKSGQKIFHSNPGSQTQPQVDALTPQNGVRGSNSPSMSGFRSRDSIVRARTIGPSGIDNVGIYEAMTGSRLLARPGQRRGTCSEDNRPHSCDDSFCTATTE